MERKPRDDGSCACPFSAPGQGDPLEPVYQNPPAAGPDCFTTSQSAFVRSLVGFETINSTTCEVLQQKDGGDGAMFLALYHMDMSYCGLSDPLTSPSSDPGVDKIINICDNIGYSNLHDPGWPSTSYQCSVCASDTEETTLSSMTIEAISTTATATSSATRTTSTSTGTERTSSASSASSIGTTATAATTTNTGASPINSATTVKSADSPTSDHRLSTQGIVAIAVCTTLGLAAAAILLLTCILRRRRRRNHQGGSTRDYRGLYSTRFGGGNKSNSHDDDEEAKPRDSSHRRLASSSEYTNLPPLLDPSEACLVLPSQQHPEPRPPLTPPPRLRDRKLLPSLLRPLSAAPRGTPDSSSGFVFGLAGDQQRGTSSLYSHQHNGTTTDIAAAGESSSSSFPPSPICTPTTSATRLEPRVERMHSTHLPTATPDAAAPSARLLSPPPPVSFTFPPRSSLDTPTTTPRKASGGSKGHRRGGGGGGPSLLRGSRSPDSAGSGSSSSYYPLLPHHGNSSISSTGTAIPTAPFSPTPPPPSSPPPLRALPPRPTVGLAHLPGASSSLHSLAEGHVEDEHDEGSDEEEGVGVGRRRDSWGSWEGEVNSGGQHQETASLFASSRRGRRRSSGGGKLGRMFGVSFPPAGFGGGTPSFPGAAR